MFLLIGHVAQRVFGNSLLFPIFLSIVGVAIMYLGVQYNVILNHLASSSLIPEVSKKVFLFMMESLSSLSENPWKISFAPSPITKVVLFDLTNVKYVDISFILGAFATYDANLIVFSVLFVIVMNIIAEIYFKYFAPPPIDENANPVFIVSKFEAKLASGTAYHGLEFILEGTKPSGTLRPHVDVHRFRIISG